MKAKLLLRRLSISAPRMRIRTHRPWYLQLLLWGAIATAIYLGGQWLYQSGLSFAGHSKLINQVESLNQQVLALTEERDALATEVNAASSRLQMEKSTQGQLTEQVRLLTNENNRLKEELGFYQAMSASDQETGLAIRSARISPEASNGQWRYRILLMQTGKNQRNFNGTLQLLTTLQREDKSVMIVFPEPNTPNASQYQVSFRRFHKIEGILNLPQGAVLKAVQIRILEHGEVRAQQTLQL